MPTAASASSSTKPLRLVSVSNDEPCLWLMETEANVLVNGHTEYHRLMVIRVMRGGQECEYVEDLGDSAQFGAVGFVMPGLGMESVGHLIDLAESQRDRKPFHVRVGVEQRSIASAYRQIKEEVWKRANSISVFGPGFRKERNL